MLLDNLFNYSQERDYTDKWQKKSKDKEKNK